MEKKLEGTSWWKKGMLRVLKIGLTLIFSWQMAQLSWLVIFPPSLILSEPKSASHPLLSSGQSYDSMVNLDVFGEYVNTKLLKPLEVKAPETRLGLVLLGVFSYDATARKNGLKTSAIIAARGGEGIYYRIGDTVQGRTVLVAVYGDRVVLETNKKLETLSFDFDKNAIMETALLDNKQRVSAYKADSRLVHQTRTFIQNEIKRDFKKTLKKYGLQSESSQNGYRVSTGSMLIQVGLKAGDVIFSVNDYELGDVKKDQKQLEKLSKEKKFKLGVKRGGSRIFINHTLH